MQAFECLQIRTAEKVSPCGQYLSEFDIAGTQCVDGLGKFLGRERT